MGGIHGRNASGLRGIFDEQTARQTEIILCQDATIAAMAETVLKLTSGEQRAFPFDTKGDPINIKHTIKLNFPRFTEEDPEGWLYQADEYFGFHGIGDESKVQLEGLHMIGKALSWIRGMRHNKLISTWMKFVEDLRERLGLAEYENKLEDLTRLQQTSTLAVYLENSKSY